jgi:hypothetical protein
MTRLAEPVLKTGALSPLSPAQFASLVRVCESSSEPLSIHNCASDCLYRNAFASTEHGEPVSFELVDHLDRRVGEIRTSVG